MNFFQQNVFRRVDEKKRKEFLKKLKKSQKKSSKKKMFSLQILFVFCVEEFRTFSIENVIYNMLNTSKLFLKSKDSKFFENLSGFDLFLTKYFYVKTGDIWFIF